MKLIKPTKVKGMKCPKCGSTDIEKWVRDISDDEVTNIIIRCGKCDYSLKDDMICKACGGEVVHSMKDNSSMLDCKKCGKHWEELIRD